MYRLMIAEDEELERQVLRQVIRQGAPDFQIVAEACTGKEAVTLATSLRPDLILLDIKMPGMDGLTAADSIRRQVPDVEIIVLTAYNDYDYVHHALRVKAADYLLKPARPEELLAAIESARLSLDHRRRNQIEQRGPVPEHRLIRHAKVFIDTHHRESLTLRQVARAVHLSPSYLSRLFKQVTGQSLTSYLTEVRLRTAQELLAATEATVEEVAKASGFSTPNYFCTVFRRRYGITPSAFRHSQQSIPPATSR
ncbi:hypothetical protein SY88_05705 [Clostridiales bacterium PH28_bin88]|nr:hypothetical protein SY88_05705 [Clostridiales bacterium PH28_bin88]